jgi:hypothetical protein
LWAQDVVLKAELSRDSIMIGEQALWSLKATLDKSYAMAFPKIDSLADNKIEVLAVKLDTLQQSASNITVQASWLITSFDEGLYFLPQIPFLVRRPNGQLDTLYSESLSLKVQTVAIDTTNFQPYDIKTPIEYPVTLGEILPYIGFGLLIAAIIALAIYIFVRWKQHKPLFFAAKPKDPPHIVALRELEKIKTEKLWQNNKIKLYYTRVTDVLRVYLNGQFHIQAMEQTSEEILQSLQSVEMPEALRSRLHEMLTVSDLVKFAKYLPEQQENESALTIVNDFVSATKPTEEVTGDE